MEFGAPEIAGLVLFIVIVVGIWKFINREKAGKVGGGRRDGTGGGNEF